MRKINKLLLLLIILLLNLNVYCGEKGKIKKLQTFDKTGLVGDYVNKNEYTFYCEIAISIKHKNIRFTDPENEMSLEGIKGIPYGSYKIDMDKSLISFYLDSGELIITLEFIDDKHFKVADYGKWLFYNINDKKDKDLFHKLYKIASNSLDNFSNGRYDDEDRIYEVQ
jgi:hypothetical protein